MIALAFLLSAVACVGDTVTGNRFAGCYEATCVDVPRQVTSVPPLVALSTRTSHTCGLTALGEAWCWGDNSLGQLGDGTTAPRRTPVKVAGGIPFKTITTGGAGFTCALAADSTAYCWGGASMGQLAQPGPDSCGQYDVPCARAPLALSGYKFTALAAGLRHVCGIERDGGAYCWGFNGLGETGSSRFDEVTAPSRVSGRNVYAQISAGDAFTCALTTDRRAYCWGAADRGELGHPDAPLCSTVLVFENHCSPTPVAVATNREFVLLSSGDSHSCALTADGEASCWGDNGQAQLGSGAFERRTTPVVAQPTMRFSVIAASLGTTCATPRAGPSVCWGINTFGKLGSGTRIDLTPEPTAILGAAQFTAFAGGQFHVCALTAGGAAFCWGSNRDGQLGTGA